MKRLPLFPLPETVVFPGLLIPLYIFEERYKQMVRDLLAQSEEQRRFVITLATEAGIREVGGYVDLLAASENPDGTFNIVCRGGERCRVEGVGVFEKNLYHTTLDRPFPLERSARSEEIVAAWDAMEAFRGYVAGVADPQALEEAIANLPDDPLYQASFLCVNLRVSALDRQALLEAPSLVARLELAQTLMRQGSLSGSAAEA
ncbi:MAG: LON peptidase substrate-binding domain-containing protein [Meiothermus sp.]|uniref:LON peptidase substrate-binding domain-containing protein n=1 Tax=Meiothermus sp. TaxID=1955249 RepID=UPI0025CF70B3|nr:LON peptidase substrate-binding domain-containing protein [Meiothermus sp.]MCS7068079.1 LON peptidase substrate-binding domain-containing protein [Meiothermus sp.]MCX7601136.1 LON peptidase substrate-binding domain-containing protein [Meiothermus sp.]MDW8426918.1 LON peptidase substrate-binding domain-containing protein [Meiothermus sp.]